MQHSRRLLPTRPASVESSPQCNLTIAYEDFETGKLAKQTCDSLSQILHACCQLTNQMWKFDILNIPKLRELATQDAKASEIVIISSRGNELPPQVKTWIESWVSADVRPRALVYLCAREDFSSTGTNRAYLEQVALRGGLEFFAQTDPWPAQSCRAQPTLASARDAGTVSTLADAFDSPRYSDYARRWGISE